MADILTQYGIKEVCDVTFYKTKEDSNTGAIVAGEPVLYLDTLKVSSVETTADNTSARGGKGNPELVTWDYNKSITVNIEDALFSAKSMAIMFGSVTKDGDAVVKSSAQTILKTLRKANVISGTDGYQYEMNGETYKIPTEASFYTQLSTGGVVITTNPSEGFDFVTFNAPIKETYEIEISAKTFPGTYYVTGDTYARDELGHDSDFQLIIPKAKVTSEVTLSMEAEGDPSTFSMSLKVLNPKVGPMMKLVKYALIADSTTNSDVNTASEAGAQG